MADYAIPMRWADIDQLGHVNNVRYVDYADEARLALIEAGELPAELQVAQCAVRFLRPLMLSPQSVMVSGAFDGETLTQEIYTGSGADRVVYATASTKLVASRTPIDRHSGSLTSHNYALRRADTAGGALSNAAHFELFQEVRIRAVSDLIGRISPGGFVVGTVIVDYADDVLWRAEPYEVDVWLETYGRSSFRIGSELRGEHVLATATAVLVGFDLDQQRSRPFSDAERTLLESAIKA